MHARVHLADPCLRTEWAQYTLLDYGKIYEACQRPAFVFDGRNLLDHDALRELGFQVHGIGKPPPTRDPTADELAAADREATAAEARMLAGAQPRGWMKPQVRRARGEPRSHRGAAPSERRDACSARPYMLPPRRAGCALHPLPPPDPLDAPAVLAARPGR